MVKITKEVKIEIDGDDVQTLTDVCEWASRYKLLHGRKLAPGEYTVAEWDQKQVQEIDSFINNIFTDT